MVQQVLSEIHSTRSKLSGLDVDWMYGGLASTLKLLIWLNGEEHV